MKLLKEIKSIKVAVLVVIAVVFSSCGSNTKQNNANGEIKPPSMDISAAAFMGNLDVVVKHIKAGSDLNKKDQYGSTPLHIAITFGKVDVAKTLIEAGADINMLNAEGSTALHTASFFCHQSVVKSLLDANVDKTVRNNYGSTALESVSGPFEAVRPIYKQIEKDLGAFGVKFNYDHLERTRPLIAEMLQE